MSRKRTDLNKMDNWFFEGDYDNEDLIPKLITTNPHKPNSEKPKYNRMFNRKKELSEYKINLSRQIQTIWNPPLVQHD
jgi:hypothetical protein